MFNTRDSLFNSNSNQAIYDKTKNIQLDNNDVYCLNITERPLHTHKLSSQQKKSNKMTFNKKETKRNLSSKVKRSLERKVTSREKLKKPNGNRQGKYTFKMKAQYLGKTNTPSQQVKIQRKSFKTKKQMKMKRSLKPLNKNEHSKTKGRYSTYSNQFKISQNSALKPLSELMKSTQKSSSIIHHNRIMRRKLMNTVKPHNPLLCKGSPPVSKIWSGRLRPRPLKSARFSCYREVCFNRIQQNPYEDYVIIQTPMKRTSLINKSKQIKKSQKNKKKRSNIKDLKNCNEVNTIEDNVENDTWYDAMETDNLNNGGLLNLDLLPNQLISLNNSLLPYGNNDDNNSHNFNDNKLEPIRQFMDLY
ncbi:unnamed protein product [Heterobilharzia americana]|nr:unnamed protein product [Heterobilharzia americana]CAH8618224.1 unnamed protein product [Heterobilharzia americana]